MVVGAFIPVDYVDYDCRGFDARLIGACAECLTVCILERVIVFSFDAITHKRLGDKRLSAQLDTICGIATISYGVCAAHSSLAVSSIVSPSMIL